MAGFDSSPGYHQVRVGSYQNNGAREAMFTWCGKMKMSRIIILLTVCFFLVPCIIHYYLLKVEAHNVNRDVHYTKLEGEEIDLLNTIKASDVKLRIEEMLRIKGSVSSELRTLEARRQRLQVDVVEYGTKIKALKQELQSKQAELDQLKISVEQAQWAQQEAILRNTPELGLPKPLTPFSVPHSLQLPASHSSPCRMLTCFDHSRCSLTSGFPVYLYDPDLYTVIHSDYDVDGFLKTTLKQTLGYNAHFTHEAKEACLFLVLVGESFKNPPEIENTRYRNEIRYSNESLERQRTLLDVSLLYKLPYWGGDGRNHVLLNLARRDLSIGSGNVFRNINIGRAMIVQSTFTISQFRSGFDLIVPPILGPPGGDVWQECSNILPARRKYLLSFQGEMKPIMKKVISVTMQHINDDETLSADDVFNNSFIDMDTLDDFILDHLKDITHGTTMDSFFFQFECIPATEQKDRVPIKDWSLCGTDTSRKNVLKESTFVLIFAPGQTEYISTTLLQARLYEALRAGAIPVVLGGDQIVLPYSEVINWKKCAVLIPKVRITELHFLLRAFPDTDLILMRRQGRMVWEKYLSSVQATVDTIIATLRNRLGIPPKPISSVRAVSVFNSTFMPYKTPPVESDPENKESLGPIEPPYPSPAFKRNYTVMLTQGYELWNDWGDPFTLYPQLPFDPVLPSDAKFIGSHLGFRPIGKGAGGAGKEFYESLGGNHPREQFTIVILTYEREQVLISSLNRLDGLPYLNKVIVVWNSPKPPMEDLRWPEIGVPIRFVKAPRNSLNNRFLPFDAIETEAVLSIDDDTHIRQDEIIFGFRVWREHRDRVVGFPGRFHAWDLNFNNGWLYNSNYSCEFSMVLTGAAFIHKYYLYLYWSWMPQAVRDKVDEYMNCEDIAMNFLVSHVTRKPPVKVTSRWTFRCPGCPVSLSESDSHFQERHKCINFFTKVFGYMPLLNTQYRADSILFKTRIPHDKQKCFKFI